MLKLKNSVFRPVVQAGAVWVQGYGDVPVVKMAGLVVPSEVEAGGEAVACGNNSAGPIGSDTTGKFERQCAHSFESSTIGGIVVIEAERPRGKEVEVNHRHRQIFKIDSCTRRTFIDYGTHKVSSIGLCAPIKGNADVGPGR